MIYILVCKHVRDSAWGVERGEGGGGAAAPFKPMLDPGLVSVYRSDLPWHIHIRKYLREALI